MTTFVLAANEAGTGSIELRSPNTDSSVILDVVPSSGTLAPLVSAAAQAASGTSGSFTNIPSWVKKITVCVYGLSTNGTSSTIIRVGGASNGILTTGYFGLVTYATGSGVTTASSLNGLYIGVSSAAGLVYGSATLIKVTDNKWVWSGAFGRDETTDMTNIVTGGIELSEPLTTIQYTTFSGTDIFDAGTINIMYE